ncbi:N-acetylmuramoyl-L-alanine amidase [Streptomyces triticisoli]|uniref:N-acetylmuramoyl-L-alanine amidase n=1 Tax=Streptomyces triticisoli TaxID=2182797 RepID=UPI000DD5C828|nr:N-acetylmuramoyl-L-alanine amidase [Streptomyces triticisoli]
MKLVTRAQWGARDYRRPNGATLYSGKRRGVKLHYLGTAYSDRPHTQCAAYVRQLQAQHMDGNGWSDIGYSFVVCTHGYVYEGRGLKRRNSANGNTTLNDQAYAVLLMVGSSGLVKPTDDQLHGARDAIDHCREEGPAGTWLGGHRDGYATACPGDPIYKWAKDGAPRPKTQEDDMPAPADVWKADVIPAAAPPYNNTDWAKGNKTWTASYALGSAVLTGRKIEKKVDALTVQVAAQSAAISKLAQLVGSGVSTEQVVAAVERAIADAVVKVSVDVTGTAVKES